MSSSNAYPAVDFSNGVHLVKKLTLERLQHFSGGHYASVNLSAILDYHRAGSEQHVKLDVWSPPGRTKPSFEEAMENGVFQAAKVGDKFGPSWTNHWFKITVNIPKAWKKPERVEFEFDSGSEGMIYSTDGIPLQGLTGGNGGDRRVGYILPVREGTHEFVIEMSCNGMFGVPWNGDDIQPPDQNRYFTLQIAALVAPNLEAHALLADFRTLREIIAALQPTSVLWNKALTGANEIMNVFRVGDSATVGHARDIAARVIGDLRGRGGIMQESTPQDDESGVWAIGHCHIDTAWLWPYSVTQQKVARSWSTQVDLMERYPEHRFVASSAQQWKWLEKLYPPLFERIKARVESGQFLPIGGAWVEHDTNMPSGEALVRQVLYGQRFFESRFGKRSEVGWLPDSFGLSGALPQILRSAGMKWFFTQKMSWNNINVFPHTTFNWVGIDGTQVLNHMTPVDTYNAQVTVEEVVRAVKGHKNLEASSSSLLVLGNGDGGGGPLAAMLESARRIHATGAVNRGEIPQLRLGKNVEDFFRQLEKESTNGKKLANWHGELYLEFHRGTYTSHGSIKKGNRKSEILLRDVEHFATLASILARTKQKYSYPKESLDQDWEKVLLNQFHDVLPGSAIGMVYEDAEKLYRDVTQSGKHLLERAMQALYPHSVPLSLQEPLQQVPSWTNQGHQSRGGQVIGLNTIHAPRCEVVAVPLTGPEVMRLKPAVVQLSKNGGMGYALLQAGHKEAVATPLSASAASDLWKDGGAYATADADVYVLGNKNLQLKLVKGRITSLLDVKHQRELIPAGQTGGLVIYDDKPNYWDAWDVEIHHLETPHELEFSSIKIVETGPLRASLLGEIKLGKSKIVVDISLDAIAVNETEDARSLIRFDARVDWHERHQILKFVLPVDIRSPNAIFETQFGYVQRPTHRNTSWDAAKFEVCGHKYVDLSEFGYGVALLSESKYGYSVDGQVIRLSLLRAATAPDAEQDQGKHEFSWAILPHVGHFVQSTVPVAAAIFNSPLHLRYVPDFSIPALQHHRRPFSVEEAPNVILETIKRGERDFESDTDSHAMNATASANAPAPPECSTETTISNCCTVSPNKRSSTTIVLRLFEAYGGHARPTIKIEPLDGLDLKCVCRVNVLEDKLEELDVARDGEDSSVRLTMRGFEIVSLMLCYENTEQSGVERESWEEV